MAFAQPIEADRPENLGFLSAFYRAPVIGSLMWWLGGEMARKLDEEENGHEGSEIRNQMLTSRVKTQFSDNNDSWQRFSTFPDRALSEISECGSFERNDHRVLNCKERRPQNQKEIVTLETQERKSPSQLGQMEKNKKMSWSDESGQNLVQYLDEAMSRSPMTSSSQPIKSAMKKSKLLQSNSLDKSESIISSNDSNNDQCRYIPAGIKGRAKGGIVVPTGGGLKPTGTGGSTGYISPQWGWYTTLTPPQGEMYGSGSSAEKKENTLCVNGQIAHSANSTRNHTPSSMEPTLPVFTQAVSAPSHGWPSVPL